MKCPLFAGALLSLCITAQASTSVAIGFLYTCKPFTVCGDARWSCAKVAVSKDNPKNRQSCGANFTLTMFDERSGKERVLWRQKFLHRGSRDVFVTRDGRYLIDIDRAYFTDKNWVVIIYDKDGVHGIPGKAFYFSKKYIREASEYITQWIDWDATVELVGPHTLRLDTLDGKTRLVDLVTHDIKIIDRPPLKAFRSDF